MKNLYLLIAFLIAFSTANSQIITIPDQAFKDKLLQANASNGIAKDSNGSNIVVDINNDNEIQMSEALMVYELDLFIGSITSLTGIENFTNLTYLDCGLNQLNSLDVSDLTNLEFLKCVNNNISTMNMNGLSSLQILHNAGNELVTMDVTSLTGLTELWCAGNQLTSLNVSGLDNLESLSCENNDITDLIVALPNLTTLDANANLLETLDANGSPNLENLNAEDNLLTSVSISALSMLETLELQNNDLTSISLTDLPNLQTIFLFNNQLTTIDVSECTGLNFISLHSNLLETMFLKNGVEESAIFEGNPTLEYICADEEQLEVLQTEIEFLDYSTNLNSYCSFVPGGTSYTMAGETRFDFNANGCDLTDNLASFMEFSITNGTDSGTFFANDSGSYSLPFVEGQHTITPHLENTQYFDIEPTSVSVDFPTDASPFMQNFCIQPNGVHPDIDIAIAPLLPARPGFDASYQLIYTNKGNQIMSGTITLTFMNDLMSLVEAIPDFDNATTNTLSWSYTDLEPFQSESIHVVFNINAPTATPPVNIDDILTFEAAIDPLTGDETPLDNAFNLAQTVVGSYDPNDIICLQGAQIPVGAVGDYVHYRIRFENTGTFPAENVVVKDTIDTEQFDLSSIQVIEGSHSFVTQINDNVVEFIFEGINLPFNDEDNDGFVLFKIKTNSGLEAGDNFSNQASIFFDFNFPIITNTYLTTVSEVVSISEANLLDAVSIFPNPVTEVLHISNPERIELESVTIYNVFGQTLYQNLVATSGIDVSDLSSGVYLIKFKSGRNASTFRFVKK